MSAKKYTQKTVDTKREILKRFREGESQNKLAEEYGIEPGTIRKWRKKEEDILKKDAPVGRKHVALNPKSIELEERVYEFLRLARERGRSITGPTLRSMAIAEAQDLKIEDFKASDGWLSKFKSRHGIKAKTISGEAKAVDIHVVQDWKEELPAILRDYEPSDVFNCDETGLFFKTATDRSLVLPGDDGHGHKKFKDRVTVMLCCNMMGEKCKPWVIGKSENPRALKGANRAAMPVRYVAQTNSWMTGDLFEDWIKWFDSDVSRANSSRQVLLFMDNASVHTNVIENTELSNTRVIFFPKNTTSRTQPLDAGIIQNFKMTYRSHLHKRVMYRMRGRYGGGSLQGFEHCSGSFLDIEKRCFTRCGFIKSPAVSAEPETKIPEVEQQLQDAEQADNAVFYPPAEPSEIMKQARKNVQIRTPSGDAVQKSKPDCDSADEDTKEPPSSSKIKQNLEEILVYATLRGDTEFLDGKLNLNAYSDVVA